jgi:hypothetical protein
MRRKFLLFLSKMLGVSETEKCKLVKYDTKFIGVKPNVEYIMAEGLAQKMREAGLLTYTSSVDIKEGIVHVECSVYVAKVGDVKS